MLGLQIVRPVREVGSRARAAAVIVADRQVVAQAGGRDLTEERARFEVQVVLPAPLDGPAGQRLQARAFDRQRARRARRQVAPV